VYNRVPIVVVDIQMIVELVAANMDRLDMVLREKKICRDE
jgi:hypothetical protein